MVHSKKFAAGLAWLVFWSGRVAASAGGPGPAEGLVFRAWGTEAGLPQNTVNAIVQTRDGYLWLGTRDGLARFDGVRFTVFGLREGLQSMDVQALLEDAKGTLWIGTTGGGLSRMARGRIERVSAAPPLADDNVSSLAEDADGQLWIGTRTGLRLLRDGQVVANEKLGGLAQAAINSLLCTRDKTLWIATARQGLYQFKTNQFVETPGPPGDEKILSYCLLEDRARNLWASVGNGKVLCREKDTWRVYNEADGLPFAYITCLAEDAGGNIWAGSLDDGLYRFTSGRFLPVRKEDGLSASDIRSLHPDRAGNLWVGTRTGGLNWLTHRKVISCGPAQGLTNDFTRSVAQTADGTFWVGTIGGGLYQGDLNGFNRRPPESPSFYYAFVDSVLAARDGTVWYGARRGLIHLRAGEIEHIYGNETWLRSASVTALCEDLQGGLWVGTSEGELEHFEKGEFSEFPRRISRGPITALAQQADGSLWVGSEAGGLNSIRAGNDEVFSLTNGLLSQSIRALYLDAQGTLWIGTAGGGLSRWGEGRMKTFTSRQGLGADKISQIVEDDAGSLWLGSNRGIFRLSKRDLNDQPPERPAFLHPQIFGLGDGMPVEECSSGFCPAGLKTKSGLICISTVKGLVFLDPRRQETNAPPPSVLLEEVLLNGQLQEPEPVADRRDSRGATNRPILHLAIPPGGRDVELHYTGISFEAPEKIRFRYRLDGWDQSWTEAGGRRVVYYPRLRAGDYAFRLSACNADGLWSDETTLLSIRAEPYLSERGTFQASVALGVLLFLGCGAWLIARRRYKRRLAVLETRHAVERERLRISQDMHDDVGSTLTQISQLSDLGQSETGESSAIRKQFERIGQQALTAVQALDEIVWATNPRNDNLPQFADYVCRYADEYFEGSSIRCWQEVPTTLPNLPLPADVRHNVFLSIKEAFSNISRHSHATEMWVSLALSHSSVRLNIKDNGRGFSPEKLPSGGNGLENMKARLGECGGHVEFTTAPGQGTNVLLVFPLPPTH
ncbi:putative signal transduction histidine kinase [Verrucomicrobia bacterium]|nr:putative signal transduction histidine kinase [Verrucomicrobiota bacterium]